MMIIILIALIICTRIIMEEIKELKQELKEDIMRIADNGGEEKKSEYLVV